MPGFATRTTEKRRIMSFYGRCGRGPSAHPSAWNTVQSVPKARYGLRDARCSSNATIAKIVSPKANSIALLRVSWRSDSRRISFSVKGASRGTRNFPEIECARGR